MSEDRLTLDSTVARALAGVICKELDGELFLVNPIDQRGFVLNAIGARVWELLEQPTTFAALVEQLLREFQVDAGTCASEVGEFLVHLRAAELIRIDAH